MRGGVGGWGVTRSEFSIAFLYFLVIFLVEFCCTKYCIKTFTTFSFATAEVH